jgi:hypothetical protein
VPAASVAAAASTMVDQPAVTAASATTIVQIKSPPGQYRPGGTSSYAGTASGSDNRVEVASLPSVLAPVPAAVPQSPLPASDPWSPPTSAPNTNTTPTSAPAVRQGVGVGVGGGSVY